MVVGDLAAKGRVKHYKGVLVKPTYVGGLAGGEGSMVLEVSCRFGQAFCIHAIVWMISRER